MAPNLDAMVRDAVSAYRAGRKDEARTMLLRAVEIDQYHEQAWLWLSAVVESVDEQRTCLENVITINPNNERAKQGLQVLIQKASVPAPKPVSAAQEDDLLASTHFGAPAAPSNPFGVSDEEEELPDNIWDGPVTASSSASSNHKVNEPSPEEYDNWVSNLNLGGTPSVVPGRGMDAAEEFMSSQPYDEEEEVGSDDAFNLRDMLGTDLDMVDIHDDEDDVFGPLSNTPPPAAPKREIASRSQPPPNAKVTSPGGKRSPGVGLDDGDEEDEDDLSFIEDDDDDFFDDGELDKLDASEFFQYIPKEITATRMPGTRERYPALVLLGLIVFLGLNIGAVALFIQRMTAG